MGYNRFKEEMKWKEKRRKEKKGREERRGEGRGTVPTTIRWGGWVELITWCNLFVSLWLIYRTVEQIQGFDDEYNYHPETETTDNRRKILFYKEIILILIRTSEVRFQLCKIYFY